MHRRVITSLTNRAAAIPAIGISTIAILLFTTLANAAPKPTACTSSISACGCTVTAPGTYTVTDDLASNQGLTKAGNCLEVSADHVILDVQGHAIIGSGTGIGILIQNSAHDTVVQGTDLTETGQSIINTWGVGLEDDANNVVIELFRQIGGNNFNPHGNAGDAVLLQNATGVTVANFNASFNGGTGVDIQGGSDNRILNCDSISNAGNGFIVASSNVNTISNCSINGNTGYGVWLNSANQNQIFTSSLNGNGKIGVLVGCHKEGKCTGNKGSDLNHISSSGTNGNGGAGITVEEGSSNNQITNMSAAGNGGTADLIDNNPGCDGDLWFNNAFGDASQSCIH
ncbi:right-handed parallel beta-helix repeat-containing protein [Candidatus Binatus sp.]|uniref:right-handed parallel beta-helix repeat-containing protein n=1 Tax=Candidatus Binatus sp. TaxID=2811406 RepID=UPI003BAFBE18